MNTGKHIANTFAGAVRLVTLRLSESERARAAASRSIGSYVGAFLESEVKDPFRYKQFSFSAFAVSATCSENVFNAYILDLHERLKQFLFGTDQDKTTTALFFAGTKEEIALFLTEPVENAIKRSEAYIQKTAASQYSPEESSSTQRITPIQGKRPLLFRGILECKHDVLLAYAITPSVGEDFAGDLDLASYLAFRGDDAVEFEIRVMERASAILRSADSTDQKVIFTCPVSYGTLQSNQQKRDFTDAAMHQPRWVRDHMILSVLGAPSTPSSSAIQRFSA